MIKMVLEITAVLLIAFGLSTIVRPTDAVTEPLCDDRLGVEDGSIPLEQLNASSEWNNYYTVDKGRLNAQRPGYPDRPWGWCADPDDTNAWIQVDLGEMKQVTGIITQGNGADGGTPRWVTSYYVYYDLYGDNFEPIQTKNFENKEFSANSNQHDEKKNMLNATVNARFVRLYPVKCYDESDGDVCCLRFEVLGCPVPSFTTTNKTNEVSTLMDEPITRPSTLLQMTTADRTEPTTNIISSVSYIQSSTEGNINGIPLSSIVTQENLKGSSKDPITVETQNSFSSFATTKKTNEVSTFTDKPISRLLSSLQMTTADRREASSANKISSVLNTQSSTTEGNIKDTLLVWIVKQDNFMLQQLKGSPTDSLTVETRNSYSTATWIGNATYIKYNVVLGTNESASISVHVPPNDGNPVIVIIYVRNDEDIDAPFDDNTTETGKVKTFLMSGLLSVSIYEGNQTIDDASVEYSLLITQQLNESSIYKHTWICGFYNTVSRKWSAFGCNIVNITVDVVRCYCSHLTTFAVLLKISNDEITEGNVSLRLTDAGVILSIIFLVITLLIICGIKDLRNSERYLILRHLAIALLSVNIFFALLDVDLRNLPVLCSVLAGCLHYSLLAAFSWMLIMSTDLCMKIRYPFKDHKKRFWYSRFAAWIGPIIVVGVTAALTRENYASDDKCWLDSRSGAIWTFIVPVCTVLLIVPVQLVFIGYVVFKKSRLPNQTENEKQKLERMRTMLWRIALLTPSVGVLWVFGIIMLFNESDVIEYIFVILNSSQGLLVWLSQCVFSQEVRTALKKTFGNKVGQDNSLNLGLIN